MSDAAKVVQAIPSSARAQLLQVLESPSNVRADAIRQFYERPDGKGLAEVLMDLEADDSLRIEILEVMRSMED